MKRSLSVIVVAVLAVAGANMSVAHAIDQEGVKDKATWSESDSPVRVTGNLVVHELTITEGTEVVVEEDALITITGKMTATGEDDNPIVIRGAADTRTYWAGIKFTETQDGSVIRGTEISNADVGLDTNRREWRVSESYFHDNGVGANVAGVPGGEVSAQTGDFRENYVSENTTGVIVTAGLDNFSYNTVTENETGMDLRTVKGAYSDSNVYGNSDNDATSCNFVGTPGDDNKIDANGNWWGTTDSAAIASNICDGTDGQENAARPTIEYSNFEAAPVEGAASLEEPAPSPSPSPSATVTPPPDPASHARTVTLTLRRHLKARGTVSVSDGFAGCMPTTVAIQRRSRRTGVFTTVKQAPVDTATGTYITRLKDKPGVYQTTVAQTSTETDVCMAANSATARHRRHRR